MNSLIGECHACGARSPLSTTTRGHWEIGCSECHSTSFLSLTADNSAGRYADLYDSGADDDQFSASLARLRLKVLTTIPSWLAPPPRLRTSDRVILQMIRAHDQRLIFDWGCGSGRLLQALRRASYESIGIEVSDELISALNQCGLKAIGAEETGGWEGKSPTTLVLAEVLEHLPAPSVFLSDLRRRFPESVVYASVPSPSRREALVGSLEEFDYPPNHLTRFTPEGLIRLFERTGYEAKVVLPLASPRDYVPKTWMRLGYWVGRQLSQHGPESTRPKEASSPRRVFRRGPADAVGALAILWGHFCYLRLAAILGLPEYLLSRNRGISAGSMVVTATANMVGEPDSGLADHLLGHAN